MSLCAVLTDNHVNRISSSSVVLSMILFDKFPLGREFSDLACLNFMLTYELIASLMSLN